MFSSFYYIVKKLRNRGRMETYRQIELGQSKVRSLKLNPGLPNEWQGPKYLSPIICCLQEAGWEAEVAPVPGILTWDAGVLRGSLTCCSKCLPLQHS